MALLDRIRINEAVLWSYQYHDVDGDPAYADPVQVPDKVRWETRQEEYIDGATGAQAVSAAVVYVNQDVAIGDVLWQGLLADKPDTPPQDLQVRAFTKMTNARGTKTLRIAYLGKKGNV